MAGAPPIQDDREFLEAVLWIPPKSNRKTPIPYDRAIYREYNRVERFFNKHKQFRCIATRHEKLHWTVLAFVQLATAFISLCNS